MPFRSPCKSGPIAEGQIDANRFRFRLAGSAGPVNRLLENTPFAWTFHCMIPKRIDLAPDGRTATGIWYLWEPAVTAPTDGSTPQAVWLAGVYQDTYRKQADDRWLIARLALETRLMAPYETGWAQRRIVTAQSAWTDSADA